MNRDNALKIGFVFIVSYVFLFVLSSLSDLTGFRKWGLTTDIFRLDYMYALLPVAGFFFMFFLVDWIESFFETRFTRTPWFGVFVLVMGIVAFYIASFWFFCNVFGFSTNEACGQQGAKNTLEYLSANADTRNVIIGFLSGLPGVGPFFGSFLGTNFFRLFLESAFVLFLLSAVFGWAARLIYFKLEGAKA
ncbi:MAG: hypothetical protein HY392_04260 [Candidatus Diapherotrites archaeon]|nr:hypothetical protein [Candidatus Diapherotrites archaeon]